MKRLGRRQAASHEILDLAFPGSNPGAPANIFVDELNPEPIPGL
jgi:hypothetical protein